MWQIVLPGFTLGLISSFHCIGMCGPLVLSLPVNERNKTTKGLSVLTYHSGRILVYAFLGLLFGLAGRRIYLAGFQQGFSIFLGVLILLLFIQSKTGIKHIFSSALESYFTWVREWIASLWAAKSQAKFLLLGMANGLLPCGMVYLAIAGALSLSQIGGSILFMTAFGAGTLPTLLLVSFMGHMLSFSLRHAIRKTEPYFVAVMGILLILRGLNLGIPLVSPVLAKIPTNSISCH
jgi:uncharacterized protein